MVKLFLPLLFLTACASQQPHYCEQPNEYQQAKITQFEMVIMKELVKMKRRVDKLEGKSGGLM